MENSLNWQEESCKIVYNCRIFSITERSCRSPSLSPKQELKTFTVLDTADWAIVIPVLETQKGREFIMVRQWRHGAQDLSLEFPGGVFDKGEDSVQAAIRELKEETGYTAGKMIKLGDFNPNPAIMSNHVHFFLAQDLVKTGPQDLDDDEYVTVETVPWKNAVNGMGKPPFIHALMATALMLYLREVPDN